MIKQTKYQNPKVIVYARNAKDRVPTVREQSLGLVWVSEIIAFFKVPLIQKNC